MKKFTTMLVSATLAAATLCSTAFAANTIEPQRNYKMEDELKEGIFHVGFTFDDVTDKDIFASMYDSMNYDIVDISQMAVGDTIVTDDGEIEIETIDHDGSTININGGYDQGGYTLISEEDTNGWIAQAYELPVYQLLGQAQLTLGGTITLNVFKMDDEGNPKGEGYDTTECKPEELKDKLEESAKKISEYLDEFSPEQMTVRLEEGKVVEVTLNYVP